MDEQTRFFLWLLLSCGFFALLAGVFGAVTGFVTWSEGRAAGTFVGQSVARAFGRLRDAPLSPAAFGTVVGGVDGAVFGVVVGAVAGAVTGWHGGGWEAMRPVMLVSVLLVGAALGFGVVAQVVTGGGVRAVLGLFAGGMLGAGVGLWLGRLDGLVAGAAFGAAAGALLSRARRP